MAKPSKDGDAKHKGLPLVNQPRQPATEMRRTRIKVLSRVAIALQSAPRLFSFLAEYSTWAEGMMDPIQRRKKRHDRGQGLVEFALVIPMFLLLVMGIVEFGRLMAVYTGITSASREGARYGAAVGENVTGVENFRDCTGIREAAKRVGVLAGLEDADIIIHYDNPTTGFYSSTCPPAQLELGDRIVVQVNQTYEPIVPLIGIPPLPLASESRRTILRDVYVK